MKEAEDVKRASDNVDAVSERERALEAEIVEETRKITAASATPSIERLQLVAQTRPGVGPAGRPRMAAGLT